MTCNTCHQFYVGTTSRKWIMLIFWSSWRLGVPFSFPWPIYNLRLKHWLNIRTLLGPGTMGGNGGRSDLKNAVIAFVVPLPSILFYYSFLSNYESAIGTENDPKCLFLSTLWKWCYHHPLLLANALFFFNVNVLFWVIGQIQSSHWVCNFFHLILLKSLFFFFLVCFKIWHFCFWWLFRW